jgi:hypothetical protein
MKLLLLLIAITTGNLQVYAQGVFTNDTHSALQNVVYEFGKGFPTFKGQLISSVGGKSEYKCNIPLPSVMSSTISQYRSAGKDLFLWQAILFSGSDFNQAEQKYKEVFDQLVNAIIKSGDGKPYILNGNFEAPDPSSPKNTSFTLLPLKGEMNNIKIELSLQNIKGWIVGLKVCDKRFR